MFNHSQRSVSKYKSNPTALELEVQRDPLDIEKIEKLIKKSVGGKNLTSVFFGAVKQGKKEVIKLFLQYPENIDFSVNDGFYGPLHLAIQKDDSAFPIKELFEDYSQLITSGKIDINAKDYRDQTPLHIGALESKVEWVQPLLKFGADLHAKDIDGNTPLSLAMRPLDLEDEVQYDHESIKKKQMRQAEVIKVFLESGKINIDDPVDEMGNTLLHLAVVNDNNFILSEILKHKPNFNVLNKDGISPLDMAVEYQKHKALKLFLEYACEHDAPIKCGSATDSNERDALKIAIENNYGVELIKKLLEGGANPNTKDNSGYTALHCAADYSDDPKVLELLIQYKADPKIENNEGHTSLDIANQYDNQEIIKILETASKDSKNNEGHTSLDIANQYDNQEIIKILETASKENEKKASKEITKDSNKQGKKPAKDKLKGISEKVGTSLKNLLLHPLEIFRRR